MGVMSVLMGALGSGGFISPSGLLGAKGAKPPAAPPAPEVGKAPMTSDLAAQDAAANAGVQQAKYGGQGTILTSGRGTTGANVQRPGLTAPGQTYPTLFAKYLGE